MLKKMIKTAAIAAVGFLAGVGLSSTERSYAQDYSQIEASPALWTIQQGDATVHLFGTFHLLPEGVNWRNDLVNEAFAASDHVWFEADVLSPDAQASVQALIPQLGLNEPGVALSSLLDEDTRVSLAAMSASLGIPTANLEPLKPWLAGLVLATTQLQALGFDPTAGVEAVLNAEAREAGKTLGYFETVESQMRVFADLTPETQVQWLALSLEEMSELQVQMEAMVTAWATGDMNTLDAQVNGSMRDASQEVYEAIMVNRNQDWIPLILGLLEQGGTHFVAVGAGHLPGEDGVVTLLEAEGLTVTRR